MLRFVRGYLLGLLIGCTVLTVNAQETVTPEPTATPTPVPQFIKGWDADVIFPQGFVFYFDAIIPLESQVASISLLIEPEDAAASTVTVPLNDDTVFTRVGDSIAAEVVWQIPNENAAPRLFSEVTYTWNLRLNTGEADAIRDVIAFTDHRADWQITLSADLPLRIATLDPSIFAPQVFDEMAGVFEVLAEQADFDPDEPANFIIYSDDTPIGCSTNDEGDLETTSDTYEVSVPCDLELAQTLYRRSGWLPLQVPLNDRFTLEQALTHALVRVAYPNLVQAPEWFQFGYARLLDPTPKIRYLSPALVGSRGGTLVETVTELEVIPSGDNEDALTLWEAQGFGLVLYIAERFGLETLYTLAAEVSSQQSLADAYQAQTGETLDALFVAWEIWIFSDEAPRVYNIDLYSFPTPTPTPIRTATPLPPTRTPFPTFTPSATWIPSPTPTLVPPSPTPTLRLARDVFTPTPTPTPMPETVIPGVAIPREQLLFILLGVVIVAIGLIAIGAALSSSRRRR
jgi:hypothetical protein